MNTPYIREFENSSPHIEKTELANAGSGNDPPYAVRVVPRIEKRAATNPWGKGFEEFLPLHRRSGLRADRYREVHLPLFSGYVLCRFDGKHCLPILTTPGAFYAAASGNTPMVISELSKSRNTTRWANDNSSCHFQSCNDQLQ